jgi:hypothetical protein
MAECHGNIAQKVRGFEEGGAKNEECRMQNEE